MENKKKELILKLIFETIIRHKFLCITCKNIDDIINVLKDYINLLEQFKNNKIVLDPNSVEDDYNRFITDDPNSALKFKMTQVPEENDESA